MRHRVSKLLSGGLAACLGVAAQVSVAHGLEGGQSHYLKGYRDFLSGVMPAVGLMWRDDFYVYSGKERSPIPQGRLAVDLQTTSNILALTVVTPLNILGANYAFTWRFAGTHAGVDRAVTTPIRTTRASGSLTGLNDSVFVPFALGWHVGNFHWTLSTPIWFPIGSYDVTRVVNTGRNYYSWAPQASATYLDPESGWEASVALTYLINTENTATHVRSGDILHVDYAFGRRVYPGLVLGAVGYTMTQITPDTGIGNRLGEHKSEVYGIGPGLRYVINNGTNPITLVAKYYREFSARNTTAGDAASFSARIHF